MHDPNPLLDLGLQFGHGVVVINSNTFDTRIRRLHSGYLAAWHLTFSSPLQALSSNLLLSLCCL